MDPPWRNRDQRRGSPAEAQNQASHQTLLKVAFWISVGGSEERVTRRFFPESSLERLKMQTAP